jgi:hypothetical protein
MLSPILQIAPQPTSSTPIINPECPGLVKQTPAYMIYVKEYGLFKHNQHIIGLEERSSEIADCLSTISKAIKDNLEEGPFQKFKGSLTWLVTGLSFMGSAYICKHEWSNIYDGQTGPLSCIFAIALSSALPSYLPAIGSGESTIKTFGDLSPCIQEELKASFKKLQIYNINEDLEKVLDKLKEKLSEADNRLARLKEMETQDSSSRYYHHNI